MKLLVGNKVSWTDGNKLEYAYWLPPLTRQEASFFEKSKARGDNIALNQTDHNGRFTKKEQCKLM